MTELLVLDFDGVISDSAPESFLVATRTYIELCPDASIEPGILDLLKLPGAEGRGRLTRHPLFREFLAWMPLGNRAEDYAVALKGITQGIKLPDQAGFDDLYARQDPGFLRGFHERFYQVRSGLSQTSAADWGAWMSPYAPFVEILRRRSGQVAYAIATAKDGDSVALLLEQYRIADLFEADRICDKESGRSKRAHLESLQKRTGIRFEEITFVDDKVNHLLAVETLGVGCVLAAWGYNGDREIEEARARGYRVCDLTTAEASLFGDS